MMASRSNKGISCCCATTRMLSAYGPSAIMMSVRGLYCMFIKMTSAPPLCSVSTPSSSAALKSSGSILRMASRVPVCHITKSGFSSTSNLATPRAKSSARGMAKLLVDEKPDLVIWQTGTLDAIRRIEPEDFRAALDEGVETLHKGGADVILMNMQYSPRTDIMVALGPYADNMRVVAQQHEIPLFDRLAIMRHWSDTGAFDLYAAGKDNVLAQRVHDCIGRAIASMIIDAAHLEPVESKAGQ